MINPNPACKRFPAKFKLANMCEAVDYQKPNLTELYKYNASIHRWEIPVVKPCMNYYSHSMLSRYECPKPEVYIKALEGIKTMC